ncbi:Serine carboxypeptidase [Phyllobacterium sp. YR620]|uniref:S10 family serine carboxypeptidase-like protein n=1 Tax=Phyllobacterium sp. YR620 TaxID=1881066 RepID=UPI00088E4600|nr:peptidase [Phyllobacterium sp. YR620]SDO79699.1 Serine carboxypeptidase [Phyllobacterium sp. YR620]
MGDASAITEKAEADANKDANSANANSLLDVDREAGELLANAGREDEAFALLAPKDKVVNDTYQYDGSATGSLALKDAVEVASAKRDVAEVNGKSVPYTASAGHFIAYDLKTKEPQASLFYTAYTRNGLPKEKRPVTFFWNGGPESASIWLHLGSWAPRRLKTGAPVIPEEYKTAQPQHFPLVPNVETLLDKSDLVFIDPPGASYSQAIAPHTNSDFWGVDQDPPVIRDFIRRYVNVNNRQLSPKYVYGESYGGIRTPIVANLMEDAGKSQFEPDKSGKDPVVLSGVILNSPVLAYDVTCSDYADEWKKPLSCAGLIPTYAMVADWHKVSKARPAGTSVESYLSTIRKFMVERFAPADAIYYKGVPNEDTEYFDSPEWSAFVETPYTDLVSKGYYDRQEGHVDARAECRASVIHGYHIYGGLSEELVRRPNGHSWQVGQARRGCAGSRRAL